MILHPTFPEAIFLILYMRTVFYFLPNTMPYKIDDQADLLSKVALPMSLERVAAGFPSPAQDYIEDTLNLNELCVRHPDSTFYVRVSGNSMRGIGIYPGDVLVVDRSLRAHHGDIVIAVVDGEFTVKELALQPKPALLARNPDYPPIRINAETEVEINGVVTHAICHFRGGEFRDG